MDVPGNAIAWGVTILSVGGALCRKSSGDYDFSGPIWFLLALFVSAVSWAVYFAFR